MTNLLTPIRDMSSYLEWLRIHFLPLTVATPPETQEQLVENAIRYWNTHSAYKISTMISYNASTKRAQLPVSFKGVVEVYPSNTTTWIWNDIPLWTILGLTILDNVTSDLIMMSEAFRTYRLYVGTNFQWTFQKSDDLTKGGYLYAINLPKECQGLFVVGTKRVVADENITVEYILEWVLKYALALLKQVEGHTLRVADIIDIKTPGSDLVKEGREEQENLEKQLTRDGRWAAFVRRVG